MVGTNEGEPPARTADGVRSHSRTSSAEPVCDGGTAAHRELVERIDGYVDGEVDDETVRDAYERITDGFFAVDASWRFTYLNRRAAELLETDRSEVLGERVCDTFPRTEDSVFYERSREAMEEQRSVSYDGYHEGLDAWFRVHAYPSEDGMSVYFRDITESKRYEREAREMRDRLDTAVEAAELGVWDWDVETGEVRVNENWNEMMGYPREEKQRTFEDWEDSLHPEDLDEAWDAIDDHFAGETDRYEVEFRVRRDGVWRWIRAIGRVVESDDDGEPSRVVGVHVDIDETKRKERAVERRNEYLRWVEDASKRMIAAESEGEVEEVLVDVGGKLFLDAEFYRWEDGTLMRGDEAVTNDTGDPAWEAFSRGETMVTDTETGETRSYSGGEWRCTCPEDEGEDETSYRLDTPVGETGVLSLRLASLCDTAGRFVYSLVASAETSLETVEKERRLRVTADKLQEKKAELRRVSEIDGVVRDLIKGVVGADSPERVRTSLCDRLAEVDGWEHVWFVEEDDGVEVTCSRGDEGFPDALSDSLGGSPLLRSLDDGNARFVHDVARSEVSEWRREALNRGYLSVATVPVKYGCREFGVVEVYSSENKAFDGDYSDALVDAANVAGYALTALEHVDSLLSDGFERLTLKVGDDDVGPFARLASQADDELRINAVLPEVQEGVTVYFNGTADVTDAREEVDVDLSETTEGYCATVADGSLVNTVVEEGGRVSRLCPIDDGLVADVDLPGSRDATDVVETVSEELAETEIAASESDEADLTDAPLDALTDRQESVLRLAHEEGFFEEPRRKTGQELADEMGITATTFHQHLRSAEKKLVDDLLD